MILPTGDKVTLPADWESLTMEQLALLGISPGMTGSDLGIEQLGDSGGGFFTEQ